MPHTKVQATLASLLTLTAVAISHPIQAADHSEKYIKCYGVAAANKNDCGTSISSCGASVHVDRACYAWVYMPEGICKKLAGASVGSLAKGCKEPKPTKK